MGTKFNNQEIQRECKVNCEKIQIMHDTTLEIIASKKARIISDFNGQSYGHSKRSLKGEIIMVREIIFDRSGCQVWDGDFGHCFIPIGEIEFLEDESCGL